MWKDLPKSFYTGKEGTCVLSALFLFAILGWPIPADLTPHDLAPVMAYLPESSLPDGRLGTSSTPPFAPVIVISPEARVTDEQFRNTVRHELQHALGGEDEPAAYLQGCAFSWVPWCFDWLAE